MHRRFLFLPILLLSLGGPAQAADSEVTVVGALDFAFKDLSIQPGRGSELETSLVTISPGLTWAYGRFYTSVSFDKSIDAANVTQISDAQPSSITMSRSDITATLGFRVTDYLSIFAGWLKGDTAAHIVGYRSAPFPPGNVFFTQDISYIEHGPFAGFAISHAFGDKGSLSFAAAYASLSADFTETVNYATDPMTIRYTPASTESKGLSYGLTWTGPLTGNLNYRLGAKLTRYDGEDIPNSEAIDEQYTVYFLGISNYF
jgi:hypothetical protein